MSLNVPRSAAVVGVCCGLGLAAGLLLAGTDPVGAADPPRSNARAAAGATQVRAVKASRVRARRAQAATAYSYDPPLLGHYSIDAMDMAPDSADAADDYTNHWTSGSGLVGNGCYTTGVHVPNGATLVHARVYFTSGPGSDMWGRLVRKEMATGGSTILADAVMVDDSGTQTAVTLPVTPDAVRKVDNERYSYGLAVCPGGDTFFHAAQIRYKYKNAGD